MKALLVTILLSFGLVCSVGYTAVESTNTTLSDADTVVPFHHGVGG